MVASDRVDDEVDDFTRRDRNRFNQRGTGAVRDGPLANAAAGRRDGAGDDAVTFGSRVLQFALDAKRAARGDCKAADDGVRRVAGMAPLDVQQRPTELRVGDCFAPLPCAVGEVRKLVELDAVA